MVNKNCQWLLELPHSHSHAVRKSRTQLVGWPPSRVVHLQPHNACHPTSAQPGPFRPASSTCCCCSSNGDISIVQPHWKMTTVKVFGQSLKLGEFRRGHFVCLSLLNKLNLLPLARDADAVRQIESTQRAFRMHCPHSGAIEAERGVARDDHVVVAFV